MTERTPSEPFKDWITIVDEETREIHIVPFGDWIIHYAVNCPCNAEIQEEEDYLVYIHNAIDGRDDTWH